MTSLRSLSPQATDPDARAAERLAAIEARLTALESQRFFKITSLGTYNGSGASVSSNTYHWDGGKLWIMWWGSAVGPGSVTTIGIQLMINGSGQGVSSEVVCTTSLAAQVTVPAIVGINPTPVWTPGADNSYGFTRTNTSTASWSTQAIAIESPAPPDPLIP